MTKMGQKTGTLKTAKKVRMKATAIPRVPLYQNLNSGKRRMKGRNSSFVLVGNFGPSSSSESSAYIDGSTLGERNAMKRLR